MHTHFKRDILKMRAFLSNLEILQSYKKREYIFLLAAYLNETAL